MLRNSMYVQGKSASRSYMKHANVRKQEEEIVVGIVLIIVKRGEVTAGPHGTTLQRA